MRERESERERENRKKDKTGFSYILTRITSFLMLDSHFTLRRLPDERAYPGFSEDFCDTVI